MLMSGYGISRGIQMVRVSERPKIGAIINIGMEDVRGHRGSY